MHFVKTGVIPMAFFALLVGGEAMANATYSYTSNASNPIPSLYGNNSINISFTSAFLLAPNTIYEISVTKGVESLKSWYTSESKAGSDLAGKYAPIQVTPNNLSMQGQALLACTGEAACFGGAIKTNGIGTIVEWNLISTDKNSNPYKIFVSYNTAELGNIDLFGMTVNGIPNAYMNSLNGPVGYWTTSISPVPEPGKYWMLLAGLVALRVYAGVARRGLGIEYEHAIRALE